MRLTACLESPIGRLYVQEEDDALVFLGTAMTKGVVPPAGVVPYADTVFEKNTLFACLQKELNEYFSGTRTAFSLPVRLTGTPFQNRVWTELRKVPFGEAVTYGALAAAIGIPGASRAVGGACNRNPLLLLVPCHRVVGADGRLTGFTCGLDKKIFLLRHEHHTIDEAEMYLIL